MTSKSKTAKTRSIPLKPKVRPSPTVKKAKKAIAHAFVPGTEAAEVFSRGLYRDAGPILSPNAKVLSDAVDHINIQGAAMGDSTSTPSLTKKAPTQVDIGFAELDGSIENLQATANELDNVLSRILPAVVHSEVVKSSPMDPALTPIAQEIRERTSRLALLGTRLAELVEAVKPVL